MVRTSTKVFGILSIVMNSIILLSSIILTIFIVATIDSSDFRNDMADLNGPQSFFGSFLYIFSFLALILLIVVVVMLTLYVTVNIINFIKIIRNNMSYNLIVVNLIMSILYIYYMLQALFPSALSLFLENEFNIFDYLIGSLIFFVPVSGLVFSILGMKDYKRIKRLSN